MLNSLAAPLRVPVRRFRPDLAAVLRRVRADGVRVVLTRRGAPVAGLVPVGVLDLLAATAQGLRDGTPVPVRRFRRDLPAVLHRVRTEGLHVVLTRRGVAVAAVVPVGVLGRLDAVDGLLARRAEAAAESLHDVASAAPDVAPPTQPATASSRRARRRAVPPRR